MDDSAAISLLERMINIRSVSTHEGPLAQFLVDQMAQLGFRSYLDEAGNAVGEAGTGPTVVLLGHIDTVPGDIPVRVENGRLYGRGAVDAKGPFATFVAAAARVLARGTLPVHLVLVGAVEEEVPSSKGAHHVVNRYEPTACVIGEPSGWERLTLGYKGRLLINGRWEQHTAHSAGREVAVAERAVAFWNMVHGYCTHYNADKRRLFDQLQSSLQAIRSATDHLTDWAELTIGLRLPLGVSPDDLVYTFTEQADGGALHFAGGCYAYLGDKSNALVRAFLKGVRSAGGKPGFLVKTGTSDMNVVGPVWNCPILAYGPGDSHLDHTPDEHIELAEYLQAIRVLEVALERL
ncbi:MAG: [LysW]-lysine hydrolase [Chloroflexi bacterium AL-W]|nr:[LysW]-lysine hydrolase [Chloroflexi bacterium AL-N1]NOK66915.1 [LysW]-lysine hydrolase [Chloroflexi bacterium AL-N10]NOK74793.1 [LysW]-lysine hydrolase [Chloroflexi bacterium AL-N5]NOK81517.1 [LysW]-lysine hydrolase [Chloroflexi bacterium AL-W]NOK88987.1 [LysW]-lysine hydrolase [Chloroflexi bacterium AL-N15]